MARHRLLKGARGQGVGWRWAARLGSAALGVCLGTAFVGACASDDDECGSEPDAIEVGAFSVRTAQSGNAELGALLTGPEPATIAIGPDRLCIDYVRDGVPVSVVYDVARRYE